MNRTSLTFGVIAWLAGLACTAAVAQNGEYQSATAAPSSSGLKGSWDKVTHALTPEPSVTPAPDPTMLQTPAKPGPELFVAMGRVAEQRGNGEEAERLYQKALSLNAKDLGGLMALARLRDRQNRTDEAVAYYQQAARAHAKEAGVYNDLGLCYAKRRFYHDSITSLQKAVQLQPQKPLYRNNLAAVLVETGDVDGAYAQLAAVHEEAVAYYNLGYLMYRKGQPKAAAVLFNKALERKPSMAEARIFLERLGPLPLASPQSGQTLQSQLPRSPELRTPPPSSATAPASPITSRTPRFPTGDPPASPPPRLSEVRQLPPISHAEPAQPELSVSDDPPLPPSTGSPGATSPAASHPDDTVPLPPTSVPDP